MTHSVSDSDSASRRPLCGGVRPLVHYLGNVLSDAVPAHQYHRRTVCRFAGRPEPGILCTEMKRETGSPVSGGLLKHTSGLSPGSGRGDSETARSACGRPDCPRVTSLSACSSGANRNVEPTARLGPGHVRSTAEQSLPLPHGVPPGPLTAGPLRPTVHDCVPSAGTGRRGSWDRLSCNETARPWNLLVGTYRQSQSLLRRGGDRPALQTLPPLHSY